MPIAFPPPAFVPNHVPAVATTEPVPAGGLAALHELIKDFHVNVITANNTRGLDQMHLKPNVGGALEAACAFWSAPEVVVMVGFKVPIAQEGGSYSGTQETDGPLGAAMIALACLESRRPVSVVCDHHTQALVEACLTELSGPTAVFDVTFFSFEPGNAARVALRCRQIATILTGGGRMPLIIPIETAGRTADGIARSMRGIDITAFNPNFDQLAAELLQVKCPMLAIGDGGNELGMGAVTGVPPATNGLPMQADFAAHFVVKATVSNWGGYFLYATDKLLRGQGDQMPRVDQHDRAIGEMLRLGAVDGFTLSSDPTFISAEGRPTAVDGLPLSTHSEVWSKCLDFAQSPIQRH